MNLAFLEGKQAAAQGKSLGDCPYAPVRTTKLGAPVYDDNGNAWRDGYASVGRRATPKEVADAAALDVRNFGRRYRREGYAK